MVVPAPCPPLLLCPSTPSAHLALPSRLDNGALLDPASAYFLTQLLRSPPGRTSALEGCDSLFFELAPGLLSAPKEHHSPGQTDGTKNGYQAPLHPCQAWPSLSPSAEVLQIAPHSPSLPSLLPCILLRCPPLLLLTEEGRQQIGLLPRVPQPCKPISSAARGFPGVPRRGPSALHREFALHLCTPPTPGCQLFSFTPISLLLL